MYLWGSSGITHDLTFSKPLILHVNNDTFGERITVGTQVASGAKSTSCTQVASGAKSTLGTLEAGECVSIPVQGISGIVATCSEESTVRCLITASHRAEDGATVTRKSDLADCPTRAGLGPVLRSRWRPRDLYVRLGEPVVAFDFQKFYEVLGSMPTVPGHPARLL